jgi:hypothetical protein
MGTQLAVDKGQYHGTTGIPLSRSAVPSDAYLRQGFGRQAYSRQLATTLPFHIQLLSFDRYVYKQREHGDQGEQTAGNANAFQAVYGDFIFNDALFLPEFFAFQSIHGRCFHGFDFISTG